MRDELGVNADAGPDFGHFGVHHALVLAELGHHVNLDVLCRRLLHVGYEHAALARVGGQNADVGWLGLRMLPGLLSVVERLEVGDVRRARRRLRAVIRTYTGIREWPSRHAWTAMNLADCGPSARVGLRLVPPAGALLDDDNAS